MSRPVVGDIRTQKFKRRRNNGDIYVYERTVKYNPNKGYNETISSKLIAKIVKGTDVEVPTRNRKTKKEAAKAEDEIINRSRIGLTSIFEWVGKESGIDEDVRKSLATGSSDLADKVLSIVRYWVATGGDSLPNISNYQLIHNLPYDKPISEDVYHDVFNELGTDETYRQQYFRYRADRVDDKFAVAYDSTTSSTYSQRLQEARYGFNKANDGLPTIKIAALYSLSNNQPIAFAKQAGNIPDVVSIKNVLKELDFLGMDKPMLVTDNGYYSNDNIAAMCLDNIKFLTHISLSDGKWIREEIDKRIDDFKKFSNKCPFDDHIYGITVTVERSFNYIQKYNTSSHKKGETVKFSKRLYLHLFLNESKVCDAHVILNRELDGLKSLIEQGAELSESAQRRADKYFTITRRKDKIKAVVKEDVYEDERKYCGYLALLSNKSQDTFDALANYRRREHIEDMFCDFKQKANGSKPRVWDSETLMGRLTCQFIALGYYEFLYNKIRALKNTLGNRTGDADHDTEMNLNKERKLRGWLKKNSLHKILNWFDCVEMTTLPGAKSKISIISETTERDRFFLEKLGYVGPMLNK